MFLSDRDLAQAIADGHVIVEPKPASIDPTSIDLHLTTVDEARIWDIEEFRRDAEARGQTRPSCTLENISSVHSARSIQYVLLIIRSAKTTQCRAAAIK